MERDSCIKVFQNQDIIIRIRISIGIQTYIMVWACIEKTCSIYSLVTHEQQAISCVRLSKCLGFLLVRVERWDVTITNYKTESW